MRRHLAIFSEKSIEAILSGKKKFETRFSIKKITPFGAVSRGDLVYIKPPGKDIVGQFKVKGVVSFDGMDENNWKLIREKFGPFDKKYLDKYLGARYGTVLALESVEEFITSPVRIKKSDLRGWMVLD